MKGAGKIDIIGIKEDTDFTAQENIQCTIQGQL